jgi:hypothetical protein
MEPSHCGPGNSRLRSDRVIAERCRRPPAAGNVQRRSSPSRITRHASRCGKFEFALEFAVAFASSDGFKPPILPLLTAISVFPNSMHTSTTAVQHQLCEISGASITRDYGKLCIDCQWWENLQRRYYTRGRDHRCLLRCARFRPNSPTASVTLTTPIPSATSRSQRVAHQSRSCLMKMLSAHIRPTASVHMQLLANHNCKPFVLGPTVDMKSHPARPYRHFV